MRLRDDERGQSVQIGAVLLFATLIIAFSSYQAFVVPQQNEEIEFNHNQQVQQEMQDLRNAVVSMPGGGSATATSVTLGTTYPSRAVAQNPGPASGSLRTAGTENELVNLSIRNATADGETGDVWDGARRSYNTGAILYDPAYNRYGEAPRTTYEHSVLYNEFRSGTILKSDQGLVDGRTISLVVVNGSLSRTTTGATSVDVRPVSSSTETVLVRAPDGDSPVTINFTSRLPASRWQELLSEEDNVRSVSQHPAAVPGPVHAIQIKLEPGVAYRLQLTKVGVGNRVTDEAPAYLTDLDGEGTSVTRGESQRVTLSVRDGLNNPVSSVTVNASVGPGKGSFADARQSTGDDGEVTFEYQTTGSTATGTHRLNFTTNDSSVLSTRPFDQSRPKNVSVNVTVTESSGGGSAGAYTLSWKNPEETSGNSGAVLTSCSSDACTWDVGSSSSDTLDLNATVNPAYEGLNVDFAVSNSTVGTISPEETTTNSGGGARTTLTAENNGSLTILASGSDDGDDIDIAVENVGGSASGTTPVIATRLDDLTDQARDEPAYVGSYNVSNTNSSFQRVDVTFDYSNGGSTMESSQATRAGFTYNNGFGAGNSYDVVYEVVYTDSNGDEYVAASQTVTDVADARNPSGNADLSTASTVTFNSWYIEDRTNVNKDEPSYRYSYDLTATGSFSQVELYALNLPGSGASGTTTLATRGTNNEDIKLSNGANDDYRVGILVRDGNGAVVEVVDLTDQADGTGFFEGP